MNAEEYIEKHVHAVTQGAQGTHRIVTEDDALEAVTLAKKDIAQYILEVYRDTNSLVDIVEACYNIIDF